MWFLLHSGKWLFSREFFVFAFFPSAFVLLDVWIEFYWITPTKHTKWIYKAPYVVSLLCAFIMHKSCTPNTWLSFQCPFFNVPTMDLSVFFFIFFDLYGCRLIEHLIYNASLLCLHWLYTYIRVVVFEIGMKFKLFVGCDLEWIKSKPVYFMVVVLFLSLSLSANSQNY